MRMVGQYRTENELREKIKRLEEIAKAGEMTLPQAQVLDRARAELETIVNAQSTTRRQWPTLYG